MEDRPQVELSTLRLLSSRVYSPPLVPPPYLVAWNARFGKPRRRLWSIGPVGAVTAVETAGLLANTLWMDGIAFPVGPIRQHLVGVR